MNRKYVATLAGVALLILVVGLMIKPSDAVQVAVPEAEGGQLLQLSQERSLRMEASYFAERISALSPQVVYLADSAAPGVRWDSAGLVLATRPDAPMIRERLPDTVRVAQVAGLPDVARWVIALARQPDGSLASAISHYGGSAEAVCAGQTFREMILDFVSQPALAGAGLFDLNGRRVGMIVHCGNRLAALPNEELQKAWSSPAAQARAVQEALGATLSRLDSSAQQYFGTSSGLLVTQVIDGSAAEAAGLRPGDILVGLNGQPVQELQDLAPAIAPGDSALFLTRRRADQETRLRLPPLSARAGSAYAFELSTSSGAVVLTRVTPGTALYRAGLRSGDRILQVGNNVRPQLSAVRQALMQAESLPVFVVIQRGAVQHGLLISR